MGRPGWPWRTLSIAPLSARLARQGTDADIASVKVELPKQLPSRLTTLQKACTAAQFDANPAGCPSPSVIGHAIVHTPLLSVPLREKNRLKRPR